MALAKNIFLYNLKNEGNFKKCVFFRFLAFSSFYVIFEDDSKLLILKLIVIIVNIEILLILISSLAAWRSCFLLDDKLFYLVLPTTCAEN